MSVCLSVCSLMWKTKSTLHRLLVTVAQSFSDGNAVCYVLSVCLSVCPSVRLSVCHLSWLSPSLMAMQYVMYFLFCGLRHVFTARRYASVVYAVGVCPSICLSVRPSVTNRHCTKLAKHRNTQITPGMIAQRF